MNSGRVIRSVEVTVVAGKQAARMVLGLQNGTDPNTGEWRRVWGVVDNCGQRLTHMAYSVRDTNPAMLIRSMDTRGHELFYFHTGAPITITRDELLRAGRELGLIPPERYSGVEVPAELFTNWGEVEAEWWRRGVRAAVGAQP